MRKNLTALILSGMILLTGCGLNSTRQAASTPLTSDGEITKAAEPIDIKSATSSGFATQGQTIAISSDTEATSSDDDLTENKLEDTKLTLVASGDVLSHITNTQFAKQADGTYDFMPQLEGMSGLLSDADYTLVNLESPIAGEKFGYRGFPKFNAPVNLGVTLKKLGVDLAITANNHAMDNGFEGIKQNLANLEMIGLEHTGTNRTQEEADQAFIKEINGIKIGFIATSYGTNNIPVPNKFAVDLNSNKLIRKKIAKARELGAELIVHHVHWGQEYTAYPSQYQLDLYKVMVEEGVDVIIGSHPHRLQPMEMRQIVYQGKTKNQAVIWSTGNMWQGQKKKKDYVNLGSVFRIGIQRKDGVAEVTDLDYDLIYNLRWKVNGKEHYKVIPREDMELYKESFPDTYQKMKEEFKWGDKTLNSSVEVIYSDGTKPEVP